MYRLHLPAPIGISRWTQVDGTIWWTVTLETAVKDSSQSFACRVRLSYLHLVGWLIGCLPALSAPTGYRSTRYIV